jgi:hypothetical protein
MVKLFYPNVLGHLSIKKPLALQSGAFHCFWNMLSQFVVLKAKNFKADEIEKTEFTEVNEYFEIEVQRRNSKILEAH